jgi:hypothetical protein
MDSMNLYKVIVICSKCGRMAPYTPPYGSNIWGVWNWHQPCPFCGENAWVAHEPVRDWKTGKPLDL